MRPGALSGLLMHPIDQFMAFQNDIRRDRRPFRHLGYARALAAHKELAAPEKSRSRPFLSKTDGPDSAQFRRSWVALLMRIMDSFFS